MIGDRWPLVSAATMRALDRHTIDRLGVPGELLMESAGRAVADVVLERFGGRAVFIVCGSGNNGGDGLVAARHLACVGVPVQVALLGRPRGAADAAANLTRLRAVGVRPVGERWRIPEGALVVDAIFGTGLTRGLEGAAARAVRRIQRSRPTATVVSVDLPSGLDADTGQVLGVAVEADVTVTLGLPKLGLALEPGRSLAGEIVVARIGIADEAPGVEADAQVLTRIAAGALLPKRPRAGHKGTFGHALLVAGSEGKTGAAALSAQGAARSGAGLVTLACPAGLNDVLEVKCTETMTAPMPDTPGRALSSQAEGPILELAAGRESVGLGPGLGLDPETVKLVGALVQRIRKPLVLDADGLNALAGRVAALKGRRAPTILTPHPGEAARLLETSPADVNRDRIGAARLLAERSGCTVLLKGAASVTAGPDGRVHVNPTGGPALASGGSGDVLLGVVAGLLAQGMEPFEAASVAAFVHGDAADRLAERVGDAGTVAEDLARELPAAMAASRSAANDGAKQGEERNGRRLALPYPGSR